MLVRLPIPGEWIVISDLEYFEDKSTGQLYTLVDSIHSTRQEAVDASNCGKGRTEIAPGFAVLDLTGYIGAPVGPLTRQDIADFRILNGRLYLKAGHKNHIYRST